MGSEKGQFCVTLLMNNPHMYPLCLIQLIESLSLLNLRCSWKAPAIGNISFKENLAAFASIKIVAY